MKELEQAEDDFAHQALMEAVENQIADGHPREAGLVMMALTARGLSHEEAMEKMVEVLASHIAESMEQDAPFDLNGYARDLLALEQH